MSLAVCEDSIWIARAKMARPFGEWLREQLDRQDLDDAQFAARVGLSKATVSYWISGERFPRRNNLPKIAGGLFTSLTVVRDAWLSDGRHMLETEDASEPTRLSENERLIIRLYRGIESPEDKELAQRMMERLLNANQEGGSAADTVRQRQEANTIGKRADRVENPPREPHREPYILVSEDKSRVGRSSRELAEEDERRADERAARAREGDEASR